MFVTALPQFLARPHLVQVEGRVHRVTKAGCYRSATGQKYWIDVGFLTDGASVPRFLWFWFPPFADDYQAAVILHDLLYRNAESFTGSDHGHLSRRECDDLMKEASLALGFRETGAEAMWMGTRIGGWRSWRKHRKAARASAAHPRL